MPMFLRTAMRPLAALCLAAGVVTTAHAAAFSIGNTGATSVFFVQGQSFTPGVLGNTGSGSAPASGSVLLDSFGISFAQTPLDSLYIYATLPTLADAATGVGALAAGTHVGGGVYDFANVVLDVNTRYYAVLPQSAEIVDGDGDTYGGGVDLFDRPPGDGQLDEGFGTFDISFSASFNLADNRVPIPATPALLLLGLAAVGLARRR